MQMTITEALAEIKTIGKRIEKKQTFIVETLIRPDGVKDPLEKSGGSVAAIAEARQSINDLHERRVALRRAIRKANEATEITVGGSSRPIADWLTWKREVAGIVASTNNVISRQIAGARTEARKRGAQVVAVGQAEQMSDLVVHLDEKELAEQIERHEEIMGALDGQLSLKNATVMVEV